MKILIVAAASVPTNFCNKNAQDALSREVLQLSDEKPRHTAMVQKNGTETQYYTKVHSTTDCTKQFQCTVTQLYSGIDGPTKDAKCSNLSSVAI